MNASSRHDAPRPVLSVVIPTLNGEGSLEETLHAVRHGGDGLPYEIVLVDGGSRDNTVALAKAQGCRVVYSPRGRGRQMALGGEAARGAWLLFLHDDTRLEGAWHDAVKRHIAAPQGRDRAGVFSLRFTSTHRQARRVAALANWRTRAFSLPYADQGLLIHRDLYRAVGGHRPLPIMEDVDMSRRLGARRIVVLDGIARTSDVRYRKDGWWRRPLKNLGCLALYFLGVPPRWIARLYS